MLWMTPRKKTTRIVIHHTAGSGEDKSYWQMLLSEAKRRFESYSYAILYDPATDKATIKKFPWPDNVITNHAFGANRDSMGIAVEGNFMKDKVPAAVINELLFLLKKVMRDYGLTPDCIVGHRDVTATACPGDNLYREIPNIRERLRK